MFSCEYWAIFEAASNYGSLIVFLENICYSEQKTSTIKLAILSKSNNSILSRAIQLLSGDQSLLLALCAYHWLNFVL